MIQETIRVTLADLLHFHGDFKGVSKLDFTFDLHTATCEAHPPARPHVVVHTKDGFKIRIQFRETTHHSYMAMCYLAVALRGALDLVCSEVDIWGTDRKPIDPSKSWWTFGEETLRLVEASKRGKLEELIARGSEKHTFHESWMSYFQRRWEKIHVHNLAWRDPSSTELIAPPVLMQLVPAIVEIHDHKKCFLLLPEDNGIVYSMVSRGPAYLDSEEDDTRQMFADIHFLCSLRNGVAIRNKTGPLWTYLSAYREKLVVGFAFHRGDEIIADVQIVTDFEEVLKKEHYDKAIQEIRENEKEKENTFEWMTKSRFMDC